MLLLRLFIHSPLLGLAIGPIVTILGNYIHRMWSWLDGQPAIVKQIAAVVLSMVLVGLVQLVPGAIPEACVNAAATGISGACQDAIASGPFLNTVLSSLVAVAVKHGMQKDDATKTADLAAVASVTTPGV